MPSATENDLKSALPDVVTSYSFPLLMAPVDIYRDPWGIPHIKAQNEHDLFFAQGFATAQDRLFHMDYDRMRCLGRWAEYAGPRALPQDRLNRRRKFERIAKEDYEQCSPEARAMIDAYAEGVNAFLDTTNSWPIEYKLLGVRPERWEPWQCILTYKVRNTAEGNFHMKLWMARLAAEVGAGKAAAITPGYLPGMLLTLPPGTEYGGPVENAVEELAAVARHISHFPPADGESNGWAVAGERTESGRPLVAGDSHRTLDVPNVYYQTHLSCPAFAAVGHAVPGFPGVLHFMHNEYVAWGMTHGMGDVQDLFVEQFRDRDGRREYLFKNDWKHAEVTTEVLKVRGAEDVAIEVTETHHGHIVAGEPEKGWGLALADPGSMKGGTKWVDAAYRAMKSKSCKELEDAFSEWTDRTNNYPNADVQGNFGYMLKGRFPIRHRANGWGPVPGWTGEHEWQGMVPPDQLPVVRNPEQGWVVTCNQRTLDQKYKYYISNSWAPEYRARRIADRIQEVYQGGRKMTVAEMASIHAERVSIPARVIVSAIKAVRLKSPAAEQARGILASWNGEMDRREVAPLVFAETMFQLVARIVRRHYGKLAEEALSVDGSGGNNHISRHLIPLIVDGIAQDEGRGLLKRGETWAGLLSVALTEAVAALVKDHGSDMTTWKWGIAHKTGHTHPLAATFPDVASLLNPPRTESHGDWSTPCNGSHALRDPRHTAGPVNRYVHDPSDWKNSRWIVPLGASGHPASIHFADQQKLWANVETIPMLWDFEEIAAQAETKQTLSPG